MEDHIYIVQKVGVYLHGVWFASTSINKAVSACKLLASNDEDDYHNWRVVMVVMNEYSDNYKPDSEDGFDYVVFETKKNRR